MATKPRIGQIVIYRDSPFGQESTAEDVPAIVVKVGALSSNIVNLHVFTNSVSGPSFRAGVEQKEPGQVDGWSWLPGI